MSRKTCVDLQEKLFEEINNSNLRFCSTKLQNEIALQELETVICTFATGRMEQKETTWKMSIQGGSRICKSNETNGVIFSQLMSMAQPNFLDCQSNPNSYKFMIDNTNPNLLFEIGLLIIIQRNGLQPGLAYPAISCSWEICDMLDVFTIFFDIFPLYRFFLELRHLFYIFHCYFKYQKWLLFPKSMSSLRLKILSTCSNL